MFAPDPFEHSIILRTRGAKTGEDPRGNDVFGPPTDTPARAFVEPKESGEDVAARQQTIEGYWVTLPLETSLRAVDAVVFLGDEYQIDGEAGVQLGALGIPGFQKFAMTKVSG